MLRPPFQLITHLPTVPRHLDLLITNPTSPVQPARRLLLLPLTLALSLGTASASAASAAKGELNDISLAESWPVEMLREVLLPPDQWRPFPLHADRQAWQQLAPELRIRLMQWGEEALGKPVPFLPATLYLEYARNGNRSRFEAVHKARRQLLHQLVLAECAEGQGRFLDPIANCVWAICEESTWCYPAHIGAQRKGVGLPDVDEPIVALFSAETAVSLAWTLYLLGPELDKVSPRIRPRLQREVDRRILTPFLERDDFGWMAFHAVSRTRRPNNWNPWINASVLTAALLVEPDTGRRADLAHKVLRSLDRFLQPYPADGSCDEGPGYWGHAGGSLLDSLDLLASASGGKLNGFAHPLIQEIGRFICRAHICGDYFVPVGDCSARLDYNRDVVYRYGKRIQDPRLLALAGYGATADLILDSAGDRYFGRLLSAVFNVADILALRSEAPPLVRDVWLGSEEMQLMAARDQGGSCQGFYLAAWGGHNGQSHNHNDVGNFIVFADGQPLLVDVGVTAYTAKTFSQQRYEIWVMQSAYHNLPTVNGQMQRAGVQAAARQVRHHQADDHALLELDIAGAYPESARLESWIRTVRLNRGREILIADSFQLNQVSGPTSLSLMTPREIELPRPGQLRFKPAGEAGQPLPAVLLEFPADILAPTVERIDLDDERLVPVWGGHLNRITLRLQGQPLRQSWTLRLAREPLAPRAEDRARP